MKSIKSILLLVITVLNVNYDYGMKSNDGCGMNNNDISFDSIQPNNNLNSN